MSIDKVSDNRAVTGSDGGRSAANLNYILYIIAFFFAPTALIGVVLAYSNRKSAADPFRSHFAWQIRIFWRSVKFLVVELVLYFLFTIVAVLTLGVGLILYLIPFAIGIWWLVTTILMVARGMKALGLGQPAPLVVGAASVPPSSAVVAPSPVATMPAGGWYDDAERPGHKRWWDGAAWGMRDDEHPSLQSGSQSTARAVVGASAEIAAAPAEIVVPPAVVAIAAPSTEAEQEIPVAVAVEEAARADWHDDSDRPGHKRWWDGAKWGMRDDEHPSSLSASPSTVPEVPAVAVEAAAVVVATSAPEPEPKLAVAVAENREAATTAAIQSEPESSPAEAPVRYCENCGARRRPEGRFCTSCGQA